jgi:hypothetical protein
MTADEGVELDPLGLLRVKDWISFVNSGSSTLRLVRLYRWSWRFIPALLMLGVWVALIVLDIIRHVALESNPDDFEVQVYLQHIAKVMCTDFCGLVCEDANLSADCSDFCDKNCSAPLHYPDIVSHGPSIPLSKVRTLFAIRCVLFVFLLPFLIWANPFAFDFSDAKPFHLRGTRISGIVMIGMGLAAIIAGLILRTWHAPPISGMRDPVITNRSIPDPPAAMCPVGGMEWDAAQLAGIPICAEIQRLNLPASEAGRALIQALHIALGLELIWYPPDTFPGFLATPTFVLAPWKMGEPLSMAISCPATRTPADLALFI